MDFYNNYLIFTIMAIIGTIVEIIILYFADINFILSLVFFLVFLGLMVLSLYYSKQDLQKASRILVVSSLGAMFVSLLGVPVLFLIGPSLGLLGGCSLYMDNPTVGAGILGAVVLIFGWVESIFLNGFIFSTNLYLILAVVTLLAVYFSTKSIKWGSRVLIVIAILGIVFNRYLRFSTGAYIGGLFFILLLVAGIFGIKPENRPNIKSSSKNIKSKN